MDQTVDLKSSLAGDVDELGALRTELALAKLRLFKNTLVPTRATTKTEFAAAVADYTGYADVALSWSAVGVSGDDTAHIVSTRAFFQATANTADNVIGGAWLETAGGDLRCYFVFTAPVDMSTALAFLSAVLEIGWPVSGTLEVES